jgi:hypothetical protein
MNLLETIISESEQLSLRDFVARFPGPFLVQTRFPQKQTELDVSFDTSLSLQNKTTKDYTVKAISPGDSQNLSSISPLNNLKDLLLYHAVYPVEKSQRNAFQQGITIGRTNNNDIVILETTVSKFHAWIQRPGPTRREYVLFDANSHYGTLVNYTKVGSEGAALPPGAKVRLGNATMSFLLSEGLYQWAKEKRALFK